MNKALLFIVAFSAAFAAGAADMITAREATNIVSSASVTNAGAVAEAKAYTDSHTPGNYAAVSNAAMTAVQPAVTLEGYGITDAYTKSEIDVKRLPNPKSLSFFSKAGTMIVSYDGSDAQSVTMEDKDFQDWRVSKNLYLGHYSQSTGQDYSVALGVGAVASGMHSAAIGSGGVRALAMNALAIGNSVEAQADNSTAVGYSSFATAPSSTAVGGNAYANGDRSHAAGWAAIADALNSTAVGNAARVHTGSVGATAIGSGATVGMNATNAVQIGFGTNEDPETLQFMDQKVLLNRDISPSNELFSTAVLAVGLNIDTNSVAQINAILNDLGGVPIEGTATTVGGLLLALAAAVAWLKMHALRKGLTGGVPDDPNVSALFSGANTALTSLIDGRLPYPINTDGTIKDRAVNVVTSGAFVIPEGFKDLLIRYTGVITSLTFTGDEASYGDNLPTDGTATSEYLITVTKIKSGEAYVRIVGLEARS